MLVKVKKKKCVEKNKNAKIYLLEGDVKKRTVVHHIARLFLALVAMIISVWVLFVATKDSAYISFTSDKSKENKLSLLHSQHINISADSLLADVSQHHFLQTKVTGNSLYLSSDSLSGWICDYLAACGITDSSDECLVLESSNPELEINLRYALQNDDNSDTAVRYGLSSVSDAYIRPLESPVLSSTAKSIIIYPGFVAGEAYQSSVHIPRCIKISLPLETHISISAVYKDGDNNTETVQIDADALPEYVINTAESDWSFCISDTALFISAEERKELRLDILGQFVLDLWSSEASKMKAYLSGDMVFQYTTVPSNYVLAEQLVDVSSDEPTLNIALKKDLRIGNIEKTGEEEYIYFSGDATQASISQVSLFPNIKMWLRENAYIAPLSLLSSIIAIYKLPYEVKKSKDRK